MNMGVINRGRS